MEISNFSSLIEVGVTLNIACVAIEYVKSYTNVLCNQVFNLKAIIINSCNDCINTLIDETTIRNLRTANINGVNTDTIRDRLVSRRTSLVEEINNERTKLENRIKDVCVVKNISSICLWLSMYGLTGLFLMGFECPSNNSDNLFIHIFWTFLTFLGTLFSILGWIRGENDKPLWKVIDYCSLRFSIFTFIACVLLGCLSLFSVNIEFLNSLIGWSWKGVLIFSMFLCYSNFAASAVEIWNKAKAGRKEISTKKDELMQKCISFNNDVNSMQGVSNVAAMITADAAGADVDRPGNDN